MVGPAEALQHEIAQAPADRVADEQRAAKYRDRRGYAQHEGEVGSPVVRKALLDQSKAGHVCSRFLSKLTATVLARSAASSTPRQPSPSGAHRREFFVEAPPR